MLRINCLLFLSVLSLVTSCWARVVIKEQELWYKEEQINGKNFSHRSEIRQDSTGTSRKEVWKIDGKEVSAPVFEEQVLEAENLERKAQRAQEQELRAADFEFKVKAQHTLVKKLLGKVVQSLMHDIKTIEQYGLERYAVYTDITVGAQEYHQLVTNFLPRAQGLLLEESPNFVLLQELYDHLSALHERFRFFMRATIDRAIEKCDDTKFLKELLVLVS